MKNHEYANLFPMMSESELTGLVADIKANGLQDPVVIHEGMILDGRNRYKACLEAGVVADTIDYEGDDALSYVISHNLHRRHLNESQRAMVASRMAKLTSGNPTGSNQYGTPPIGEVPKDFSISHQDRKSVAEKLQVGTSSLDRARRVQRDGADEVVDAVDRGELRVSTAEDLVKLPKETQVEVIAGGKEAVKEAVAKIRNTPKPIDVQTETLEKPKKKKDPEWTPEIGKQMRQIAILQMDRVYINDLFWEQSLTELRDYCQDRLDNKK